MFTRFHRQHKSFSCRVVSSFVSFIFAVNFVVLPAPSYAQGAAAQPVLNLPPVGTMISTSQAFVPPTVNGITIDAENPLVFDFVIDQGDEILSEQDLKSETEKLVRYFLASLTIPEKDLWVNLSPYEGGKVIPLGLGDTEMGRDLLAQDYLLKQLTASLMYPEEELGRKFWDKVFERAYQLYGKTNIPLNTFNKVWIVPDKAVVLEQGRTALIVESHLKVMLEEDYKAMEYNRSDEKFGLNNLDKKDANEITDVTSKIVREVLIPAIEEEVNNGETFANLRQIYHSMVLATWYKKNLKDSLLGQVYVDQNKTKGIDTQDKEINQKIYNQYMQAFEQGVYNYIRHDYDKNQKRMVQRKYFSGGFKWNPASMEQAPGLADLRTSEQFAKVLQTPEPIIVKEYGGDRQKFFAALSGAAANAGVNLEEVQRQVAVSPVHNITTARVELVGRTPRGLDLSQTQYLKAAAQAASPVYRHGMTQVQVQEKIAGYQANNISSRPADERLAAVVSQAAKEAGLSQQISSVRVFNTGESPTFGVAALPDNNGGVQIIAEESFLAQVEKSPFNGPMLALTNVFRAAAGQTPAQRMEAEYQQAMKINPQAVTNFQTRVLNGATPDQVALSGTQGLMADLTLESIAARPEFEGLNIIPAPKGSAEPVRETLRSIMNNFAISQMNKGSSYIPPRLRISPLDAAFTAEEQQQTTPITVAVVDFTQEDLTSTDMIARGLQTMTGKPEIDRLVFLVRQGNPLTDVSSNSMMTKLGSVISVMPVAQTESPAQKIINLAGLNDGRKVNYLVDAVGQDTSAVFQYTPEGKISFATPAEDSHILSHPQFKPLMAQLLQSSDAQARMSFEQFVVARNLANAENPMEVAQNYAAQNPDNSNIIPELTPLGELTLLARENGLPNGMPVGQNVGIMGSVTASDNVTRDSIRLNWGPGQVYSTTAPAFSPPQISQAKIVEGLTELKYSGKLPAEKLGALPSQTVAKLMEDIRNNPSRASQYIPSLKPVQSVEAFQARGESPARIGQLSFFDVAANVQTIAPATVTQQNVVDIKTNSDTGVTTAQLNIEVLPTDGNPLPTITGPTVAQISYPVSVTREGVTTFGAPKITFAEEGAFSQQVNQNIVQGLATDYSTKLAQLGPAAFRSPELVAATNTVMNERPDQTPGGIDFNAAMLNLQIKRDGNGVPLPIKFQPIGEMSIDGFVPVILDIQTTPAAPGPLILGGAGPSAEKLSRVAD